MDPLTDPASTSLDIALLRTFLEVVDSRGFAPAAERLALTPAGDTLYAYARNIVDMEREVRARLRGAPAHGRLRVGASEDFAGAWLPHVLRTFRDHHPYASIELKVGITASLLREQTLGRSRRRVRQAMQARRCGRRAAVGRAARVGVRGGRVAQSRARSAARAVSRTVRLSRSRGVGARRVAAAVSRAVRECEHGRLRVGRARGLRGHGTRAQPAARRAARVRARGRAARVAGRAVLRVRGQPRRHRGRTDRRGAGNRAKHAVRC
ncbi:Transcriptional regulator LysR family, partial [Burkholderia dolosa AU0158]